MSETNKEHRAGNRDSGPSSAYETIKRAAEQWCKEKYNNIHPVNAISVEVLTVDIYNGAFMCEVTCDLEGDPEPVYVYVDISFEITSTTVTESEI